MICNKKTIYLSKHKNKDMDNSSINFEDSFADLTLLENRESNFNSHVFNSPGPAEGGGSTDNPTVDPEMEDSVVPTQPGPAPKRWLC